MRLLIAEDEKSLVKALTVILEKNGYAVDAVYDGVTALEYIKGGSYDGVILDVMMPEMDGFSVLREIRREGKKVPVLILTARAEVDDKVEGLDSGANDYLTKPFAPRELLARIRAMTRSQIPAPEPVLGFGNITLNRATNELSSPTGSFQLTNKEFQVMEFLMSNPRHLISSERILEKVWGFEGNDKLNVVWVYISYLRKKLTALQADIQIRASRNAGYSLEMVHD